jgi:hypothetical protein
MVADLPCRPGLADGGLHAHSDGRWIEPDCLPFLALMGLPKALFLRQTIGCMTICRGVDLNKTRSCGHWIGRFSQF